MCPSVSGHSSLHWSLRPAGHTRRGRLPLAAGAGHAVRRAPVRCPFVARRAPTRGAPSAARPFVRPFARSAVAADAGAPSHADVGAPCHTPVVRSPVRPFLRSFVRPFARSPVLRTRAHAGGQCGQRAAGAAGGSAVAGSIRWWHTCRARGGRAGAQISPRCASFARGSPGRSGGMGAFA